MYNIIDLSQTISENTLVYPGDPEFSRTPVTFIHTEKYETSRLVIGSHCGTHADAPKHFLESSKSMDKLSLSHFVGNALVIDTKLTDNKIDTKDLIEKLKNIEDEKILIIRTGWEKNIDKKEFFTDYPIFDGDISKELFSAGIITICTDMPTVSDNNGILSMHINLLEKEIVIIEALINLNKISKNRVFFSAAPLKISDCDGSPVRAYIIEN